MNFKRGHLQHDETWSSAPSTQTSGDEDRLERLEKLILAQKDEQLKREALAEAQRAAEKRMVDDDAMRAAKEKRAAAEKARDLLDAARAAREEAEKKAAGELQAIHRAYDKAVTEAKALGRHTISEDRSAGSNLEERRLAVLKFRGPSQEPSRAWDEAESSAPVMHVPYSRGSSTRYVHSQQQFGPPRFEEEDSDKSFGEEGPTSFAPRSHTEYVPASDDRSHGQLLAAHNWVEPVNQVDTDGELQANIERLRRNINDLQRELGGLEMEKESSSKNQFQILYRIDGACYFDQPEWTRGNKSIASRRPVKNLDLFLERNKHIVFLVYRNFDYSSIKKGINKNLPLPQHKWESIRPVSRHLRKTLEIILKHDWRYKTMFSHLRQRKELDAPYIFIYHHRTIWNDILAQCAHKAREHLNLLALYVSENYGEEYMAADLLFANRKVTVNTIKYLFQPGDILVSRSSDQHRGLVAKSWPQEISRYDYTCLEPSMEEPQSDDDLDSRIFEGRMRSSNVYEEQKEHKEQESLKQFLQNTRPGLALRGGDHNKTVSADIRYRDFAVDTWQWIFDGTFKRVEGNVILRLSQSTTNESTREMEWEMHDLNLFPLKYSPPVLVQSLRRRGMIFWQCRRRCLVTYHNVNTETEDEFDKRFMIDFPTFQRLHAGFKSYVAESAAESMTQHEMEHPEPPSDDFYYLVPLQTKGFNLTTKKWLDLNVDQIGPVVWNDKAFESLVLDKDRKTKELITALVSKQISSSKSTDVIAGKGNGLILLLHGGPGTGKTLTAEGVAELAKKPLYRVTCGDVGTKAEEVENYLESVLHLGKLWDCVVLLDEAEVFLERRSLDDLQRNALVSVFLRVIEYHEGILILTSNRVGTFDEAFRSRIQIAIHYPPLRAYQRLQIWKNFFDRLESFKDGSVDVDELRDHLEELQNFEINGRDIRNAITTARQYADWKGKTMNYEHLKIALNVAAEFNDYSEKLRGGFTDDQIAEEDGIR